MFIDAINRHSKLPYYQQLYEILRGKIIRREWKPGDLIPPELELTEQYQVSRNTVRQVLDMLVKEGLIHRQRGRGSFVAHPTLEQTTLRIVSFTEDMHQRGFTPGTQLLNASLLPAPLEIAGKLQVMAGDELACIERLRLADHEPMSIEDSYLVHRYCPGILGYDYTTNPLREILVRQYALRLVRAQQTIHAIAASRLHAELLNIRPGAPLLYIERISYAQDGRPIEYLHIRYRADRYALYNELHE